MSDADLIDAFGRCVVSKQKQVLRDELLLRLEKLRETAEHEIDSAYDEKPTEWVQEEKLIGEPVVNLFAFPGGYWYPNSPQTKTVDISEEWYFRPPIVMDYFRDGAEGADYGLLHRSLYISMRDGRGWSWFQQELRIDLLGAIPRNYLRKMPAGPLDIELTYRGPMLTTQAFSVDVILTGIKTEKSPINPSIAPKLLRLLETGPPCECGTCLKTKAIIAADRLLADS